MCSEVTFDAIMGQAFPEAGNGGSMMRKRFV